MSVGSFVLESVSFSVITFWLFGILGFLFLLHDNKSVILKFSSLFIVEVLSHIFIILFTRLLIFVLLFLFSFVIPWFISTSSVVSSLTTTVLSLPFSPWSVRSVIISVLSFWSILNLALLLSGSWRILLSFCFSFNNVRYYLLYFLSFLCLCRLYCLLWCFFNFWLFMYTIFFGWFNGFDLRRYDLNFGSLFWLLSWLFLWCLFNGSWLLFILDWRVLVQIYF